MSTRLPQFYLILSGTLALLAAPAGAVVINDTFDLGSPATAGDDAADPLDLAWVAAYNSNGVSIASSGALPGGNYLVNDANSGFSMIRAQLPVDARLSPEIGQSVTVSFDFRYLASPISSTSGFRFGLFDSTGLGTLVNAGTGGSNTLLTIVHDISAGITSDMGSGTGGATGFTGPSDVLTTGTMTSSIGTGAVAASMTITRTSLTSVSVVASLNGAVASLVDVDDASDSADILTNFSGGWLVIRSGTPVSDFAIDNVVVIPEPGSLALAFTGLAAVLVIARRRSRS